jgi:hypothetical protein
VRRLSRVLLAFSALLPSVPGFSQVCTVVDYRVQTARQISLECDEGNPRITATNIRLTVVTASGTLTGAPIPGTLAQNPTANSWVDLSLASDILSGKQYLVEDTAAAPEFVAYTISTKATATISIVKDRKTLCSDAATADLDHLLKIQSKIAFDPSTLTNAQLTIQDGAAYPVSATQRATVGPTSIGLADVCVKNYATGAGEVQNYTVNGLKNIFGDAIKATGTDTTDKAPSDKTTASYYINLDAQAGQGQKPGYLVQATINPKLFNLGDGWYLTPNVNIDMGFSNSDTAKNTTDMLKFGLGTTRFFPSSFLEFEPSLQYETDRHGAHRNLLFDGEAQIFGKGWRHSIAQRNFDEYILRLNLARADLATRPVPKKPEEVNVYHWGYLFGLIAGTELGGALSADTANSSDKKTSLTLPTYDIARFKPTLSFTGEYRRVSLSLQAVPRYLFPHEEVTRETTVPDPADATKTIQQIYLRSLNGWRIFGTTTFLWKLDPAGHYAWTITHKMGSQPPNFDHVNQVESGLVVIF